MAGILMVFVIIFPSRIEDLGEKRVRADVELFLSVLFAGGIEKGGGKASRCRGLSVAKTAVLSMLKFESMSGRSQRLWWCLFSQSSLAAPENQRPLLLCRKKLGRITICLMPHWHDQRGSEHLSWGRIEPYWWRVVELLLL